MKPRYSKGAGEPPVYLSAIVRSGFNRGELVFIEPNSKEVRISFCSKNQFIYLLKKLMSESVPLSVGGQSIGPADEVNLLISSGELSGSYVEISWLMPGLWSVREMIPGAIEWQEINDPGIIANKSFKPTSVCDAAEFKKLRE